MTADAYPLHWPDGWPRTPSWRRESDRRFGGGTGLSMGRARDQLIGELQRLGAKNIVISTNIALRRDGLPYADNRRVDDPGVAAYFTLRGKPMVMARDAFSSVAGNLRSLTLAIEAMRQLERHGGSNMMERAFSGFIAIPAPSAKKHWREVFGVGPDWSGDITALFRAKAKTRHPDAGGSDALMAELNVAYQEARRDLGMAA
jgi:hypothetical protein